MLINERLTRCSYTGEYPEVKPGQRQEDHHQEQREDLSEIEVKS